MGYMIVLWQGPANLDEYMDYIVGAIPLLGFVFLGALYFLPSILALFRGKTNMIAIMALNLFLGCTLVGWVVALVWSLSADTRPQVIVTQSHNIPKEADNIEKLEKLKRLLDNGTINEQEYTVQKNRLLK
ncbi:MAG: superinfection immunity protein [Bacteroidota bacterium]